MKSSISAAIVTACLLTAACDKIPFLGKDKQSSSSPTSPSSSVSLDAFAGTWASVTASTPPTGCGNLKYTVIPTGTTTATVTFSATCGGNIAVSGSGNGTLSGSVINWSATGVVSQGGVNCPFNLDNGKAALDSSGQIIVNYSGTVCGIPVSGTELLKK